MLRFAHLRSKPRLLRLLTGISLPQFVELSSRLEPLWAKAEYERLARPGRRRALGGGHPYALRAVEDKLLLTLTRYRHALIYELLACLYGVSHSSAQRTVVQLTPLVEHAADPALHAFLRTARTQRTKIRTLDEFFQVIPELKELLTDVTEQQRYRPRRKKKGKAYYSGHTRRHAFKTQITATPAGRIVHVSKTYPGGTQDRSVYLREGLASLIPKQTRQYLDLGYEGIPKHCPDHDIRLPFKRHTLGVGRREPAPPLTRGQKQANALRKKRRLPIEHRIGRLKFFRILSGLWRSGDAKYNETFRAIAALRNFQLLFVAS